MAKVVAGVLFFLLLFCGISSAKISCLVSGAVGTVLVEYDNMRRNVIRFEKIQTNSKLILESNSSVRLCYLDTGRVEKWDGPCELSIGNGTSSRLTGSSSPDVLEYKEVSTILNKSKVLAENIVAGQGLIRSSIVDKNLSDDELVEMNTIIDTMSKNYKGLDNDCTAAIFHIATLEYYGQKASAYRYIKKILEHDAGNKYLLEMLNGLLF